MYALLSEGPDQEIVSLDVFSPQEFGAVLDYMYGEPLEFALAVSVVTCALVCEEQMCTVSLSDINFCF